MRSKDAAAARLAEKRFGVITWRQARALGFSSDEVDGRIGTGRWRRLHRGVYLIAGAPPTWEGRTYAACVAVRRAAFAGYRTAAALWHLVEPDRIEIVVAGGPARVQGVVVRRARILGTEDITRIGPIPVTRPARTLVDLATVLDPDVLEEALDEGLRRGLVTIPRLDACMLAVAPPGRAGRGVLRALVDDRRGMNITASTLETRFLRLVRKAGLPTPTVQRRFARREGTAVIDFVFEAERVAVEVDGFRWHGSRQRWQSDLARQNEISLAGYLVLRYTVADIERRPDATIAQLRRAFAVHADDIAV